MEKNTFTIDKIARIIIALIIEGLYFTNQITGTISLILIALAGIFMITGFIKTCSVYLPFDI
jgi:hypothetical protein